MTKDEELELLRQENMALRDGLQEAIGIIERLQQQTTDLQQQVTTLQQQMSKDSHNSSLPPSSDRFQRQPKSLRRTSGKKRGGQAGHKGHTLMQSQTPDHIEVHVVQRCEACFADLKMQPSTYPERRQVFELPEQRVLVSEHRVEEKQCPYCHHATRAVFPSRVNAPVQYGPFLQAFAVYLVQYQLLPYARVSELLSDVLSISLAPGTVQKLVEQCYTKLEAVEQQIKTALQGAKVVHQDETGIYVNGKCHWMHVCSTKTLTHYGVHPKRGRDAMDAIGIVTGFHGTSVHDGLQSYQGYFFEHALCNVHHLRELTFLEEVEKQVWAGNMKDALLEMKQSVEHAKAQGRTELDLLTRIHLRTRYKAIVEEGYSANPAVPPPKVSGKRSNRQSPARNMLDRLTKYQDQVLRFMEDFTVPFDNNQAERDIRMAKVQQKISGCFRSDQGATLFCRIRGYLSTMRKQDQPILHALQQTLLGFPVLPAF